MGKDHNALERAYTQMTETTHWLQEHTSSTPTIALILGSGLGTLADSFQDRQAFAYDEIPNFPTATVPGHAGELVFGKLGGKQVVAMKGRFHYYEGWDLKEVTFPVRVFAQLGCEAMIVTNSSGGVNPDFHPGDLMLIRDHLNLTGVNPLRGLNDDRLGPRFPDMTEAYDANLRTLAMQAANELGIHLQIGIYAGVHGPSYETPAEVRMLRRISGDAVGMSTVPEVIIGNHSGLRVAGISCITNYAAGITDEPLSHKEVTTNAQLARTSFSNLLTRFVELI